MKTVLLIDDDELIRESIKAVLINEGVTVLQAENGVLGLASALKNHPDLIVLDENMPEMNGQEVLENLRNDAWGADVQVIAFTVNDDITIMNKKLQAGVMEYLDKSTVEPAQLAELIIRRLS
jgi:CheY-like chemotaxis protein